ncbi:MAG TPA: hypothetical protein VFZ65_13615 [Planctomycetota bacterium]|nr:hypothetical protein [Planctomycetota bacterium]
MKSATRALALFALSTLFAACGTVTDWREMRTAPMTFGQCYDGLEFIASHDGFTADLAVSDRGLGTWESRWRNRQLGLGRPGRYRLVAEVLIDEGSTEQGWPIRYAIMQEKVKDLRNSMDPREEDWSSDGQDSEREAILGEKLVRRLAPKLH